MARRLPKTVTVTPSELERIGRMTAEEFARATDKLADGSDAAREARRVGAARAAIPPTVKRGEHRFGVVYAATEQVKLTLSDGKIKFVTKRTGLNGKVGFIDWINFTVHEDTLSALPLGTQISDEDCVLVFSAELERIFGFGVTRKCDRGRNFYARSYELGQGCGFVCHGGQRNTILVMVNGEGLASAKSGWQYRLHEFLSKTAVKPKLTRVDVAHDCFKGEYTVDQAKADYIDGGFRLPKSPTDPDCEERGNWIRPNGKGRSFYVGHRTSGKFLRVYEKGRQLGDKESPWVRVELEYKSVDRVIPFSILLSPGSFLAGAYPALGWITEEQDRISTIREEKAITKESKEEWIQTVAGPDIHFLMLCEKGETMADKALSLFLRLSDDSRLPKWSRIPGVTEQGPFMHEEFIKNRATAGAPVEISRLVSAFEEVI